MTSSHSPYEQNPLQHAHDIAFATFRVATLITHAKLKSEIEHAAIDLVVTYDAVIAAGAVEGYGQKLQALIQLAESVGHMHNSNASVLLREINALQSAIVSVIGNRQSAIAAASVDVQKIFDDRMGKNTVTMPLASQSATPIADCKIDDQKKLQSAIEQVFAPIGNSAIAESAATGENDVDNDAVVIISESQTALFDAVAIAESEEIAEELEEKVIYAIPNRMEEKKPEFKPVMEGNKHAAAKPRPNGKSLPIVSDIKKIQENKGKKSEKEAQTAFGNARSAEKSMRHHDSDTKKEVEKLEKPIEIAKIEVKKHLKPLNTIDECDFESPDERQGAILQVVRSLPNGCRMRDLANMFPAVSERTLRNDLQTLVNQRTIERFGSQGPFSYFRAVTKHEVLSL